MTPSLDAEAVAWRWEEWGNAHQSWLFRLTHDRPVENKRTRNIEPLYAAAPTPDAYCQKCGGTVEGWICQSCDQEFRENDAGNLVFDDEAAPIPDVHCFECQTELVGPLCPECNPEIRAALSWKAPTPEGVNETVEIVDEWLSVVDGLPLESAASVLRWAPICQTEIDAIRTILAITEGRGR